MIWTVWPSHLRGCNLGGTGGMGGIQDKVDGPQHAALLLAASDDHGLAYYTADNGPDDVSLSDLRPTTFARRQSRQSRFLLVDAYPSRCGITAICKALLFTVTRRAIANVLSRHTGGGTICIDPRHSTSPYQRRPIHIRRIRIHGRLAEAPRSPAIVHRKTRRTDDCEPVVPHFNLCRRDVSDRDKGPVGASRLQYR